MQAATSLQFVSRWRLEFSFCSWPHFYESLGKERNVVWEYCLHIGVWIRLSLELKKKKFSCWFINVCLSTRAVAIGFAAFPHFKILTKLDFVQVTIQARIELTWSHHSHAISAPYFFLPTLGSVTCTVDTLIFQSSKWNPMELMRLLGPNGPHVYTLVHQLSSVRPQVSREMVRCPQNQRYRVWTW